MKKPAVLVACLLLFSPSLALADFYRWIDRNGNEFFTNDRKQIPPEYRDHAVVVTPDERRVSISDKAAVLKHPVTKNPGHKDKYGRGEEYWRRKAANVRLKLRDQQYEYEQIVMQLDELKRKSTTRSSKKSIARLEKKRKKLERDIAKSRMVLDVDLPEEARRADAYPGWLRE